MIYLDFDINNEDRISHINLDAHEYKGSERESTLKEALDDLKIQNPCMTFTRKLKSGYYSSKLSEDAITSIAEATDFLANLWQYSDEYVRYANGKNMQPYMNPLHILENALNLLIEQRELIIDLKGKYGD